MIPLDEQRVMIAAMAMQGILARGAIEVGEPSNREYVAELSVWMADALLHELSQASPPPNDSQNR